jgi:superfamily II DNA or RNA helicase
MARASFATAAPSLRRFEAVFPRSSRSKGLDYASSGCVTVVEATQEWLVAHVQGQTTYQVELDCRDRTLHASCSCPYFSDSTTPCKHLWATLLVAQAEGTMSRFREVRSIEFEFDDLADDQDDEDDEEGDGDKEGEDAAEALEGIGNPRESRVFGGLAPAEVEVARFLRPSPSRGSPQSESWRDVLARAAVGVPAAKSPGRPELSYVVDPQLSAHRDRMVVRVMQRVGRREAPSWRPAEIAHPLAAHAGDTDAVILGMLEALSEDTGWRGGRTARVYSVPSPASREVIERLCASGRARFGDVQGPPLVWESDPYELALEARPPDGGDPALRVHAWLERGEQRVAATSPALVLSGGVAFWPDRAAAVDHAGQFAWIESERSRGPASLPITEVDDLLEALHRAPRAPRLGLPPEHALKELRVAGKPYALLHTPKKREPLWEESLAVEAGLDYDGIRAPLETHGRALVDRSQRTLVLRDGAAEKTAHEQLLAAGVRHLAHWQRTRAGVSVAFRLTPNRVQVAVRTLVGQGWRVEVDGRLHRPAGQFAISVTSGVDWLDARVAASFDGVQARLPELLSALRHKHRSVLLADGSLGVLPDEWLGRLRRWSAMAQADDQALRFGKAQAALVGALLDVEEHASADEAFGKMRGALEGFAGVEPLDPPPTLRGSLRDYQRYGLGWFAALRRLGFGGCLADDMGLGKTVQVLAMLDARRQERPAPGPSLVVAPRSVLHNWAAEAARFAPELRVLVYEGAARGARGESFGRYDLVLTTYGLLRVDLEELSGTDFDYVVLDEAQAIKNARSVSAKAARALRARHRLALSGTPVENHLGELASLLDFLNPGVLGTVGSLSSLAQGARRVDDATRDVLARAVRPFFLRRTKREVARELPDRIEQTIECELEGEQRRLYDELHAHYRQSVPQRVASDGVARSTAYILEALLRLRQAACHPGLIDERRRRQPSAKLDALLEQLESVRAQGQKALVFSQFTSLLSIVRDLLDDRGIAYEYLDGATRDRAQRVARFQSDDQCGVFLLSLKAGGVGLNLTAAEYVFLLDPWWNPAVEAQAIDRAHRIGQTRTVFAYKLLARGTIEDKVALLQEEKRKLVEGLFGDATASLGGLTREDLERLLA